MVNRLMHKVVTLESTTVETVKQMQDALGALQGPGNGDRCLSDTYVVELLEETLSDGSAALTARVRLAVPA